MEKASVISSKQLIAILMVCRLGFSTVYFTSIDAGASIQDVLLAVPVLFVMNFFVAIPILLLLRRHPGKSFMECSVQLIGKPASVVVAVICGVFFLLQGTLELGIFQLFYVNTVIPQTAEFAILIPILIVAVYGAVKGIEALARGGSVILVIYLFILCFIRLTGLP